MTVTRVLKAGDVRAVQQTQQVAQAAAAEQRAVQEAALSAAWSSGYEQGRDDALAAGAAASLRAAAALDALAAAAGAAHVEEVHGTSRAVLAAALDVTEWVLRHELGRDGRSLLTRLGEAAAALLPSPTPRVGVSAADEAAVRAWAAGRAGVEVVVEPGLPPGDATLDTDAGSVDVSVAAALRIAAETLGVDPARGVQ